MSNTLLNGGNLKDALKTGVKSLTDKDIVKNSITSGIVSSITVGVTDKLNNSIITNNTFTTALKEATTSSLVNTTIENTMNGGSFKDMLKDQLTTSFVMAGANLATKEIGKAAHGSLDIDKNGNLTYNEPTIGKTKQLLLHGVIGATSSKLLGNDMASGAVSSIVGEITSDLIFNNLNEKYSNKDGIILKERFELNKEIAGQISGLTGGISSLITGISSGLSEEKISPKL